MERRKAFVLAGAVTISAFTGATAFGATTGLFGFGGASAEPAPAATASPQTETRIVHIPGRATPTHRASQSTEAGRTSAPTLAATAPQTTPPAPPASVAPNVTPPTGTASTAGAPPVTTPGDDGHEYEAPEYEAPEHETPEYHAPEPPEAPEHDG